MLRGEFDMTNLQLKEILKKLNRDKLLGEHIDTYIDGPTNPEKPLEP